VRWVSPAVTDGAHSPEPRGQSRRPWAPRSGSSAPAGVALVHDWLTGMRGGEKVLDAICELYPDAPLYTLVHIRGSVSRRIEARRIYTSFIQHLPFSARLYRHCLPLFPVAVELFDLDPYDVVISTSHCAAKSVVRAGNAIHVCYCHSPMRYAWDQFEAYFGREQTGAVRSGLLRHVMARMARWDAATAQRVDRFLANSRYVAGRIRRYYNRGSTVVYPPVDTTFYRLPDDNRSRASNSLVVSALVPYKRVDVAIEACRRARVPLRIVGRGPEEQRLRRLAGPDVEFLGWRADEEIRDLYREAASVLLPGIEDFGMVPIEAQACGCPVVALGEGGACETVIDGTTGFLTASGSPEAFADALDRCRRTSFDPHVIREHAMRFSRARFMNGFQAAIAEVVGDRASGCPSAGTEGTRRPEADASVPGEHEQ
jgi:glycosyltransferase involved in cell wall biosynthesis